MIPFRSSLISLIMLAGLIGLASSCRPRSEVPESEIGNHSVSVKEARVAKSLDVLNLQISVARQKLDGMSESERAAKSKDLVYMMPNSNTARIVVKLNDPEFNLWTAGKLELDRHPVLQRIVIEFGGKLVKAIPGINAVVFSFQDQGRPNAARDAIIASKLFLDGSSVIADSHGDALIRVSGTPSDVDFKKQWGLNNTGIDYQISSTGVAGGIAGVDIRAVDAWATQTDASSIVVGMTDSGIQLNHPDLAGNIWRNPGETGKDSLGRDKSTNQIDDDANGYIDDVNGWDCVNNDNNPTDDLGHGTETAGVVGAVGNNAIGLSGVAWKVQLAALKFIGASGVGTASDAAECLLYAVNKKMDIINASWAGGAAMVADVKPVLQAAEAAGILVVAASGNSGVDIGVAGKEVYPASFVLKNLITVGSINRSGALSSFSNYNQTSTHVLAPGESILATGLGSSYAVASGTSFAAPMVAGMAALMKAKFARTDPEKTTPGKIRDNLIATSVSSTALTGKSQSNGYVNLKAALAYDPPLTATPAYMDIAAAGGRVNSCPAAVALKGADFIARLMLPAAACLTGMTPVTSYERFTVNRQCCAEAKVLPPPVCVAGEFTWAKWLISDAYQRAAKVGEAEDLGAKVKANTTSAAATATAAYGSDERFTVNVNAAYKKLLGTNSPASSVAGWLAMLKTGKGSVYLMSQIMQLPEYYTLGGGTAAKWAPFIYTNILGRAGTPTEIAATKALLTSGTTRSNVALKILNTVEYRTNFVIKPIYQSLYRRAPSTAELNARLAEMASTAGKTPEAMAQSLASAAEYYRVKSVCPWP